MKNKVTLTILLLITACGQVFCNSSRPTAEYDTIPNWQIYYADTLILKGNSTGQIEKLIDTIFYKSGLEYLTIYYNYDAVDPKGKEIEIWEGKNLLTKEAFKEKPFVINIWDILSRKTKNRIVDLKVFYRDEVIKERRLIGQLTFLFGTRPTFYHKID